ncbi:cytochrome P450 monooxygenase-like protein [Patellaria atrata CBS 101060]|uniref:Cytochrome P450 monooxygenase-like protein n=1 Tax=Patellaria atrata CBS 101060 TaxID=1346257 RepID=A0A9P4VU60_9PEZI|nr:cytochrome P450 monooxygenase-like protein [Patellaria atrata CBS 101060]
MAQKVHPLIIAILVSIFEACILIYLYKYLGRNDISFTYAFLFSCAVNLALWIVYITQIYPNFISPLRHLPSPSGAWPFLGHMYVAFSNPPGQNLQEFAANIPNNGIIYFQGLFKGDRILLTDSRALADVLVHNAYDFEKPNKARVFLRRILGDGLILVEGDLHRFNRKHLMPAFSFRHIKELYPIFWKKSIELTQAVEGEIRHKRATENKEKFTDDTDVELKEWASKVTFDIIGDAALGRDFNTLWSPDDPLTSIYHEVTRPDLGKNIHFLLNLLGPQKLVSLLPIKEELLLRKNSKALREHCRELLREKKERMKLESSEHVDILSILIRSNDFADDMLIDQLLTFLAAGHETTAAAFTWAVYLLSIHPFIQTKLREELFANMPEPYFQTNPSNPQSLFALLDSLPYLNAICSESLRLYPTVPITLRDAVRPTKILDQHIPAGTQVVVSPWAINRNPHLWGPRATEFVPERWIDGSGQANNTGGATSNYSNLTFLHGSRSCIGQGFARAELRALVAAWVGRFEMRMADPTETVVPSGVITIKPRDGLRLRLRPVVRS